MKVGILCPFYKRGWIGGVETVINNLLKHLPEKGIEAEMVPFTLGKDLPYDNPVLSPVVLAKALASSFDLDRFDIIHSHHPFVTLPFSLRRKTVLTFHLYSGDHYAPVGGLGDAVRFGIRTGIRGMEFTSARTSRSMTAVSEHIRSKLARSISVPEEKISVIHNGVDLSFIDSCLSGNPYEGGINIFSMGRMARCKGFDILLKAAALLDAKVRITIAGPREDPVLERELLDYAGSNNLELALLGSVSEREKYNLMHHADLVVLPSSYEGLSIVGVESLASKSAVIASDIGPFRELFHHTAVFFRPGDHNDLSDKIRSVLEDKKRASDLRSKAKDRREAFGIGKIIDRYADIFLKTLERS